MQFEKREMKMRRAGKAGRAAVFCLCAGLVLGDPVKGFAWEQTEYVRRATGSNALGCRNGGNQAGNGDQRGGGNVSGRLFRVLL